MVRHKDGRYLYSSVDSRGRHLVGRNQRLARRFEGVLGAWAWVAQHSWKSGYGDLRSNYRPVRLVARGQCRCP